MATLQINSITLGCVPAGPFDTLVEYKETSAPSYATLGAFTMNPDGTFVSPVQINGLDEATCYDIRLTPDLPYLCAPFVVESCTQPQFIWIADETACETEGGFGVVKTITGMSSPIGTWWDPVLERLYVADIDDPAGNILWFNDIATATTHADATNSGVVDFDPCYNFFFDGLYRRIYLVGANTNGMIAYDIDTNTMSTVVFGTNFAFSRTTMFVSGNLIICNDGNTSLILIARDTLTINATVPTSGITNPEHFNNGPYTIVMAQNGNLYTVSNNADAASIGVYDVNLNHITEIVLPGVTTWSFSNYWQSIFYDDTSDLLWVSDAGSAQRFVVDPNTNTVLDARQQLNLSGKSNCTMGFSVDPLSNNLYCIFAGRNTSSDTGPINRVYLVDRTSFDFLNMYEGASFNNLVGIPDLNWFTGTNPGGVNFGGNPGYDTDGNITVLSNSLGSDNTGNVLTLTLQEVTEIGHTPTGETKPNVPSDPDYIPPFFDDDACPLVSSTDCPTDGVFTVVDMGGTFDFWYEFSIPSSVRFNPAVDNIAVYWRLNGVRQPSPDIYSDPTLTNYYDGIFTNISSTGVRTIEVVYRDNLLTELASCVLA